MSQNTILEISVEQQAWILKELRRGRYGYLLALHILLLVVRGKTPSAIADFLLRFRASVYRAIEAWREGKLQEQWWHSADRLIVSIPTRTVMGDQTATPQTETPTPGQNEKQFLAGALD
jgi:hypothetical protein